MKRTAPPPTRDHRSVDVAFLHDVVSRQAKVEWFPVPAARNPPNILDHVPARWSYRRVTAEDEPFFLSDTDRKILAEDPEFAGNPFFSFRIHVTGEKLLAATKEVDTLAEWLEPQLIADRLRR